MRERFLTRVAAVSGVAALVSAAAFGLPWDIDMADSQAVKGFEQPGRAIPEGVVAQPNLLTPEAYSRPYDRATPEGQALTAPFASDAEALARGEKYFKIYCQPCHGDGIVLGEVAAPGRYPGVAVLAGPSGMVQNRSDGHLYLTIRNGGGIMPSYGWAMNDQEMWSIVHYLRSMPNGARSAPAATTPDPGSAQ
jgi:mono/diheme cytochrome c family protein